MKRVVLMCPKCGRTQKVDLEMFNLCLSTRGHPMTCNGGNPDYENHHDHEVVLELFDLVEE